MIAPRKLSADRAGWQGGLGSGIYRRGRRGRGGDSHGRRKRHGWAGRHAGSQRGDRIRRSGVKTGGACSSMPKRGSGQPVRLHRYAQRCGPGRLPLQASGYSLFHLPPFVCFAYFAVHFRFRRSAPLRENPDFIKENHGWVCLRGSPSCGMRSGGGTGMAGHQPRVLGGRGARAGAFCRFCATRYFTIRLIRPSGMGRSRGNWTDPLFPS